MERRMTATEARIHFGEVMRRVVEQGEQVIVERDGRPQIVLLSIAEFERLKESRPREDWRQLVQQSRRQIQSELNGRDLPAPEEIIRQMREERDEQLLVVH
jgi:prevent-host-death family protein